MQIFTHSIRSLGYNVNSKNYRKLYGLLHDIPNYYKKNLIFFFSPGIGVSGKSIKFDNKGNF